MESGHLQLKRLAIANYKSLKQVELDNLQSLTVLMGRNNAGKSNLLDCLNFIHDAARSFDHAYASRGGNLSEIIYKKKEDRSIEITFEFTLGEKKRAELITNLFGRNRQTSLEAVIGSNFLRLVTLRVVFNRDQVLDELTVSNFKPGSRACLLYQHKGTPTRIEVLSGQLDFLCETHTDDLPHETKTLNTITGDPKAFRLYLGKPEADATSPVAFQLAELAYQEFSGMQWIDPHRNLPKSAPIQGESVIAPDASNLPDVLHWLYNNKPGLFRKIEGQIQKLIPHLGKLYTPTQQNEATLGMIDSSEEDLVYTMNQLSFGTKSAIAVIAKVALAKPGTWISIEEPETYLHPQAQIGLFHFLRDEARDKRIFVATHSTAIAASCPIESLYIVQRDVEYATVVDPVTEDGAHFVIEQLGVKPSFSFESDAIVFVEEPDDAPIYEAWAKKYSFHVKIQFLDAEGGATLHFYANARIALSKYVHTLVYTVFDGDRPRNAFEQRARERLPQQLRLPEAQSVTLDVREVEAYLYDAKAILRAFPAIGLNEVDLEKRLAKFRESGEFKKGLTELFSDRRLGKYEGQHGGQIAAAMEDIPPFIQEFFNRIDTSSKPFWNI